MAPQKRKMESNRMAYLRSKSQNGTFKPNHINNLTVNGLNIP